MTRTPPNPFGWFHLVRPIGEGGMAVVYEAEDTRLGCRVALKLSHADPADTAAIERFHREARFARRLHHPYICPVYEDGVIDNRHFLTMPIIEGTPLDKRTGLAHQWVEKDAVELIRRLALAVGSVHDAGIVHRDLKPHNVILRSSLEPVLMDFGLARDLTGQEAYLTTPGTALGTLAFIPPEQARGNLDEIGPATDVYSLGIMLYLLLTGRLPFDASNAVALYQRIVNEPPTRPGDLRPGLSSRVEAIALRALAKTPGGRYESMAAFVTALSESRPAAPASVTPVVSADHSEQCNVPGTWLIRPAGSPNAEWTKSIVTPRRVPPKPGFVYRLAVDRNATDQQLAGLTPRADLDGLDLGRCETVTSEALAAVGRLAGLRELSLTRAGVGGVSLTDVGLATVAQLKRLEKLEAALTDVSDAGFAAVAGLTALVRAEFYDCSRLTDVGIAHLSRLPTLYRLGLGNCGVTDLGLRRLGSLPNLSELALEDCHRVTGTGLAAFNRLGGLRSLTLAGGRGISDESLVHVASLPSLEQLEIRNCSRFTGSGLSHLAVANKLRVLVLSGCRNLTDAATAVLIQQTALEQLDVSGCDRVTATSLGQLRRALPGCKITYRSS
ncbi:MAG: protein kinase [Planctomycetes bacterium]|nr:protein kinase [Planctomycetota bacterium]